MLVTFLKPSGNFFKKVINIPWNKMILANGNINPKKVNLFQDKTNRNVVVALIQMRVGLSESACRSWLQTAFVLLWLRAMVMSDKGKGQGKLLRSDSGR